jgi:hypothetical protein
MALRRERWACDDAEKDDSGLAAPRDVPRYLQRHPVDMTIVCIDILERISLGESHTERTGPLSSDIVASGLDGSSNKTDRTRKRGNSPPPRGFVNASQRHGK